MIACIRSGDGYRGYVVHGDGTDLFEGHYRTIKYNRFFVRSHPSRAGDRALFFVVL